MAELFISYAKPNREQATLLADELRGRGFSVWIDQGGIGGAKNWSAEIVEAINACSTMLVLLSPDSIMSHNVAKEVQLASEKGRNILPIMIERVTLPALLEYPLVGIQRVYFHDRPAIWNALELLKPRGADVPRGAGVSPAVGQPSSAVPPAIRVAVLPFDDLSPLHDNQWFADGMMDELISTLGGIEHIKIPPRSDVLHYRDHKKKSREIAGELGVRYLIEGGVRKAHDKIRINALLVDTLEGEQLWSQKFDGTFDDVFAFQELVSKNIFDALKLRLTPEEEKQIEDRGTDNAEAYELYLKGRHEQYYFTKESYLRALELYEAAVKLDPKYERAYIGMASVCCVYYREYSRNPKWLERAEENILIAQQLYGETSRLLSTKGTIEWLRGNEKGAIEHLLKSVKLDKRNHAAFNILGSIYIIREDYYSAIDNFQQTVELIGGVKEYLNLIIALKGADEKERLLNTSKEAIPVFKRYISLEPNDLHAQVSYGLILLWGGQKEDAEIAANSLISGDKLDGHGLYNLGVLFDHLGKPEVRIALFKKAIEQGYREIEQTRKQVLETKEDSCELQFQALIQELELLVEEENRI